MNDKFPWGRIIQTHSVGPYEIFEYAERGASNHPTHPRRETGKILFHVTNGNGWSGEGFNSLDAALVGAIDMRLNGAGSRAKIYACKCLGIE